MKEITVWFLFLTVSLTTYGQNQDQINKLMPKPVLPSPNVASLGKYGDYPVNLFTGLPEISIPIFEAKSGGLTVPITLSYHASGIRYTDQAGWVGLGWSLSAGGQISRNTNGKPDEQYYYQGQLEDNPALCTHYDYIKNSAHGVSDTEADVFSYSFPGKSGKFMLSQGGQAPYLIPYEPIRVTPEFLQSPNRFPKFEIVDENGTLHRFGKNESGVTATESTSADNGGLLTTSVTAWHLMEMIAPNSNDKITFSYEQNFGSSTTTDVSHHITINDQCVNEDGTTCPDIDGIPHEIINRSTITQVALKEITFEGGKVEFILGGKRSDLTGLNYLDKIKIYSLENGNYTWIKTIKFVYSYFRNANNTTDLRLKLSEVQFQTNSEIETVVQRYTFNYFTDSFSWDVAINSYRRDFWGFYNGANNANLIPRQDISYQSSPYGGTTTMTIGGAADRNVHPEFLMEGVLKRITYPTGGYTEFEFQPHQYDEGGVKYAGGLRVSKITSSDGTSSLPIVKSYKYGSGESGHGVKNFDSRQYYFQSETMVEKYICHGSIGDLVYRSRVFFSNSAVDISSYDGAPVIYPHVTEYYGDEAINIGKIVYEYDNGSPSADVTHTTSSSSKFHKNTFFWKRGKLTKKTTYASGGNKLSEMVISYNLFQEKLKYVSFGAMQYRVFTGARCINDCPNQTTNNIYANEYAFAKFPQSTGKLVESSVTEHTYQPNDVSRYVSKSTTYTIDPVYVQVTETTEGSSNTTEQLITRIKYPFSYTFSGNETGTAKGIRLLKERNVLNVPVEQYSVRQRGTETYVTDGRINTYRENPANILYVVPEQVYLLETSAPIPLTSFTVSGVSTSGITMDPRYKSRVSVFNDAQSNVLQVQKMPSELIAYLWSYNKSLPVAEVRNAKNDQYTTTTTSQSTASSGISFGGSPGVSTTKIIKVDYTGTVLLKMGVSGTPSYATVMNYSGITSGSVTLGKGGCGLTTVEFTNVSPGTYELILTLTTPDSGVSNLGACGDVTYPALVTTSTANGIVECYYEGFEERSDAGVVVNSAVAHSGKRYKTNGFSIPYSKPNSKTYILEYWSLDVNNIWQFVSTEYTSATLSGTVDDIRIYPKDAFMTNYVYEPAVGITAVIDENGKTFYYDYDNFGRLLRIRNDKGGIEKQYTYNYKQ